MVYMSSDMLREVSDSLFEFLIEAFPTSKSYTRDDIEQDPMPPLIAHFLGQSLQHRLDVEIEHIRTVRSTWFDYDHPDVQHAYKSFVAALAQYSHIPSEEWRSTLKRATKLVIAHLILPTHTLVEFVFREEDGPLAAPVIYREISYFAAYPYLREAVETFLKKRQLKEIDRTRFSSLLTQVDRHMTANYSVDQWLRMQRPLFDLMRRVPQTRNQGVPIDMLSMFFGDKEAYEIQGRLQVEKEVHRISTIDEQALRSVIEGSVGPFEQELKETTPPVAISAENLVSEEPAAPTHSYRPASEVPLPQPVAAPLPEPDPDQDSKPKPLWEQFQKAPAPEEEAPAPAKQEPPSTQDETDNSVPLWMRFQKSGIASTAPTIKQAEPPQESPRESSHGSLHGSLHESLQQPPQESPLESPLKSVQEPPQQTIADSLVDAQNNGENYGPQVDFGPPPEPASTMPTEPPLASVASPDNVEGEQSLDANDIMPPAASPPPSFDDPYAAPPPSPYASSDEPPVFPEGYPSAEPQFRLSPLEQLEHDVLGSFGAGNREMFVEHLFAGSNDEYERLLTLLRGLDSWDDASQVIAEEVFKRYQVNIYSPAAITFTEHVEEQFRLQ